MQEKHPGLFKGGFKKAVGEKKEGAFEVPKDENGNPIAPPEPPKDENGNPIAPPKGRPPMGFGFPGGKGPHGPRPGESGQEEKPQA